MGDTGPMALLRVALALLNIGMAGLVGVLCMQSSLRRCAPRLADDSAHAWRRWLCAALGLTATASALVLWVEAAAMADVAPADAWPAVQQVLTGSRYGRAWLAGAVSLLVLGGLALASLQAQRTRPAEALGFAALALFALSRSLVSHAAGADGWLPLAVDWVHLLAVSLWAGEVFVAALVSVPAQLPSGTTPRSELARHVNALSTTATWALSAVVATGAFSAWRGLNGSPAALLQPPYGQVLLLKLGLVALAVALGGYNRWAVMPKLLAGLGTRQTPGLPALRRFRAVLQVESLLLLGVLATAAVLSTSESSSP